MAEIHIQDFTDGGVLADGDLMHIQRQVSGVWTDFAIQAQDAMGTGLLPLVKTEDYPLTDFYFDAPIQFLPDISGSGLCYIPVHCWFKWEPSDTLGNPGNEFFVTDGTNDVYRSILDMDSLFDQVSPGGRTNLSSYNQGLDEIILVSSSGIASGNGRIVFTMIYHIVPNTP